MWTSLVLVVIGIFVQHISSIGPVDPAQRQHDVLTAPESPDAPPLHFVHVAKCAGRAIKHMHTTALTAGGRSPFHDCHNHRVRTGDIEAQKGVAVVVLREPRDRFESAFAFVRTGGFGRNLPKEHALLAFNSSDALVPT